MAEHGALAASFATGGVVVLVAALLRILPHWLAPLGIGVDHWYWKAYIEKYRAERKFPPDLPQYLLEKAQWYPPFFPLMLNVLPSAVFDRFSHLLAILIDMFRMVWVMIIVYTLTRNPTAVAIAGGVYALTPLLVSYNVQLNPRGAAAMMLDLVVAAAILGFFFNGPKYLWVIAAVFCGLVLLTHKMTTQLFWFLCVCGAALFEWKLALLIPLSIGMALLLSKGFYWKVAIAHWDIVTFWNRNWPWLGANPVKESPVYGLPEYETPTKAHRRGFVGIVKHLYMQLGYNPFAWLLLAILPFYPELPIPPGGFIHFVVAWLGLTLVLALATAVVPWLRSLGAGHLYLYNAVAPAALLWGMLFDRKYVHMNLILIVGAVACLLGIVRYYVHVKRSATLKIDQDFEGVLGFLASQPKGTVMCVPPQWYDVVAYKTGLPVLYGGHGYGFQLLESTFPRLMVPLKQLIERHRMRYIVLEEDAVTDRFLADVPSHDSQAFGKYRVLSLHAGA
jgi:hypothetical protein